MNGLRHKLGVLFCLVLLNCWVCEVLVLALSSDDRRFKCKIKEGNYIYDLTEIAMKDHWQTKDIAHFVESSRTYYFSVCHSLRNVPAGCVSDPAVSVGSCYVSLMNDKNTSKTIAVNAGIVTDEALTVASSGFLLYEYKNGSPCRWRGTDMNYTTKISFICSHEDLDIGPIIFNNQGCEIIVGWMTEAVCPNKIEVDDGCMINYPFSEEWLNLQHLYQPEYYSVNSEKSSFEINICGPVVNGSCGNNTVSVCNITSPAKPEEISSVNNKVLYWEKDFLVLDYNDAKNKTKAKIKLMCDRMAFVPEIHYWPSSESDAVVFLVKTSAVCTPDSTECLIKDSEDHIYDLRPLHKDSGNWVAVDPTVRFGNLLYEINVCGPLNSGMLSLCPKGSLGACQISIRNEEGTNLGHPTSHPVINSDGSVTLLYTGGEFCKDGNHSYSTRINFICNSDEQGPQFVEATSTCEYIFTWLTPHACPRYSSTGMQCSVTDPLFGNDFNLQPLRNETSDYIVSDGTDNYLINVCGPLISKCGNESLDTGICKVHGSEYISEGTASSALSFIDGSITLQYWNGSENCDLGGKKSSKILFLCDHEETGADGLHPVSTRNVCINYFMWTTKHACPPRIIIDCSVVAENGTSYDLNSLVRKGVNEEYYSGDHSKKYVLNVCHSIIHGKDSRCAYNAGACVIDTSGKNQSINIGSVVSGPFVKDGRLKLLYTNGDRCNETHSYQTLIEFVCDRTNLYPYPQLVAEESCLYFFEWSTPAACPIAGAPDSITEGNCTAVNHNTGYTFDLTSLQNVAYNVTTPHGKIFFSVCSKLNSSPCTSGSAACLVKNTTEGLHAESLGAPSSALKFHISSLSLTYDNSKECRGDENNKVLLRFICDDGQSTVGPVFIGTTTDNCTYIINFHTSLACERRIDCFADGFDRIIDLSPFIKNNGNYEVSLPSKPTAKFLLNVCRPLASTTGIDCLPGSSACLFDSSSTNSTLSLGHASIRPIYGHDATVALMYKGGSPCSRLGLALSSKIIFVCDENAGKGYPEYDMFTDDCQYLFRWKTSYICEAPKLTQDSLLCHIPYATAKANIDLTPLSKVGGYTVPYRNKTFVVNVCGAACGDYAVCSLSGELYGKAHHAEFMWFSRKLVLAYYNGDNCYGSLSGMRSANIYFECDMKAGYGHPEPDSLMQDFHCAAIFTWKTNVTCLEALYANESRYNYNVTSAPVVTSRAPVVNQSTAVITALPADSSDAGEFNKEASSGVSTALIALFLVVAFVCLLAVFLLKSGYGRQMVDHMKRVYYNAGQPFLLDDRL